MDLESLSVKELTKMCNELNIKLTKSDGTKKLKKDLVKSLQLGGKRKKSRKTSKKKKVEDDLEKYLEKVLKRKV